MIHSVSWSYSQTCLSPWISWCSDHACWWKTRTFESNFCSLFGKERQKSLHSDIAYFFLPPFSLALQRMSFHNKPEDSRAKKTANSSASNFNPMSSSVKGWSDVRAGKLQNDLNAGSREPVAPAPALSPAIISSSLPAANSSSLPFASSNAR